MERLLNCSTEYKVLGFTCSGQGTALAVALQMSALANIYHRVASSAADPALNYSVPL